MVTGYIAVITTVSIRCREMGTAEPELGASVHYYAGARFYSLSRDGDSGTAGTGEETHFRFMFLFAVARWGQRNGRRRPPRVRRPRRVSIRCREMGTAEPYPR